MMPLSDSLQKYLSTHPEKRNTIRCLDLLNTQQERAFFRDCFDDGHFVGSLFVFNPERTKMLMMQHIKLKKWLQFGGHADGSTDLSEVALREFAEESGVDATPQLITGDIIDIDIHEIGARGNEPSHYHYDIRYAATLDESCQIQFNLHEAHDVRWVGFDEIMDFTQEESVLRVVDLVKKNIIF